MTKKKPFEPGDVLQVKFLDLYEEVEKEGLIQIIEIDKQYSDRSPHRPQDMWSYRFICIRGNFRNDETIGYDYLHEFVQANPGKDEYVNYVGNAILCPAVKLLYKK